MSWGCVLSPYLLHFAEKAVNEILRRAGIQVGLVCLHFLCYKGFYSINFFEYSVVWAREVIQDLWEHLV